MKQVRNFFVMLGALASYIGFTVSMLMALRTSPSEFHTNCLCLALFSIYVLFDRIDSVKKLNV